MQRHVFPAPSPAFLVLSPAFADPLDLTAQTRTPTVGECDSLEHRLDLAAPAPAPQRAARQCGMAANPLNLGGGFIEFLFRRPGASPPRPPSRTAMTRGVGQRAGTVEPADPAQARGRSALSTSRSCAIAAPKARHHHHRHAAALPLSGAGQRHGDALRHRRRPAGLHLGRREDGHRQEGMAGLDAAAGDAAAPARPAALHGRRSGQSARRARDVSRLVALPHPRLERALDHRPGGVVRLHPHAQRGRHRPL